MARVGPADDLELLVTATKGLPGQGILRSFESLKSKEHWSNGLRCWKEKKGAADAGVLYGTWAGTPWSSPTRAVGMKVQAEAATYHSYT
jgi:hypothetical protein